MGRCDKGNPKCILYADGMNILPLGWCMAGKTNKRECDESEFATNHARVDAEVE